MSITNGTVGRVSVRYPDRIKITAKLDEESGKYCGVCDETHNGQHSLHAFTTKPYFDTESMAIEKTRFICRRMLQSYMSDTLFKLEMEELLREYKSLELLLTVESFSDTCNWKNEKINLLCYSNEIFVNEQKALVQYNGTFIRFTPAYNRNEFRSIGAKHCSFYDDIDTEYPSIEEVYKKLEPFLV